MAITDEELVRELVTGGLDERAAQALVDRFAAAVADANRLPVPGAGDAAKVVTVNAGHSGYELDALPADTDHPIPAGGANHAVLAKTAGTDYAADWTASPTFVDATVTGVLAHTGATAGFYGHAAVAQPVAIANAADAAGAISQLNLLLAALRAEGLIAT